MIPIRDMGGSVEGSQTYDDLGFRELFTHLNRPHNNDASV